MTRFKTETPLLLNRFMDKSKAHGQIQNEEEGKYSPPPFPKALHGRTAKGMDVLRGENWGVNTIYYNVGLRQWLNF